MSGRRPDSSSKAGSAFWFINIPLWRLWFGGDARGGWRPSRRLLPHPSKAHETIKSLAVMIFVFPNQRHLHEVNPELITIFLSINLWNNELLFWFSIVDLISRYCRQMFIQGSLATLGNKNYFATAQIIYFSSTFFCSFKKINVYRPYTWEKFPYQLLWVLKRGHNSPGSDMPAGHSQKKDQLWSGSNERGTKRGAVAAWQCDMHDWRRRTK